LVKLCSAVQKLSASQDLRGRCSLASTFDLRDVENLFNSFQSRDKYL